MINYFILNTKKHILCGECKENLHIDKLTAAERIKISWKPLIEFWATKETCTSPVLDIRQQQRNWQFNQLTEFDWKHSRFDWLFRQWVQWFTSFVIFLCWCHKWLTDYFKTNKSVLKCTLLYKTYSTNQNERRDEMFGYLYYNVTSRLISNSWWGHNW